jgi:hypothetical protein
MGQDDVNNPDTAASMSRSVAIEDHTLSGCIPGNNGLMNTANRSLDGNSIGKENGPGRPAIRYQTSSSARSTFSPQTLAISSSE